MAAITVETWIDDRQAQGRYTFLRSDAITGSGLSAEAVKKALQRLARRGRVIKAKDYFYVITPLEYQNAGGPPASWFIHDLMAAMRLPYYVGILTAAAQHGASHQQPQEFQVITDRSVRPVDGRPHQDPILRQPIRGESGRRKHQDAYRNHAGSDSRNHGRGLGPFCQGRRLPGQRSNGHRGAVASLLDPKRLLAAVRLVDDVPNAKRLGYLLDHVHAKHLSEPIHAWVERQSPRPVPLRSGRPVTDAPEDRRWHVLVNQPIEVEV